MVIRRWGRDGTHRQRKAEGGFGRGQTTGRLQNQKIQGGDDEGDNQWISLSRDWWQMIQTTAKIAPHTSIAGGRSHDGGGDNGAMVTSTGNNDLSGGAHRADVGPRK